MVHQEKLLLEMFCKDLADLADGYNRQNPLKALKTICKLDNMQQSLLREYFAIFGRMAVQPAGMKALDDAHLATYLASMGNTSTMLF